jgi:lysophospholipase L1-like esterase
MKTIVCYGDSNTHGSNPAGGRFGVHERWPGVLRDALGTGYWVVEEGLGGRTTVWPDAIEGEHKSGKTHLPVVLESHAPIDLVIVLLGTNDLKMRFGVPAQDAARGVGLLASMVQRSMAGPNGLPPKVLLIAPPSFAPLTGFAEMFLGGVEKSRQLAGYYREMAQQLGCDFLDAGEVIVSSPIDGIHWEVGEHARLGQAVAEKVRKILG